MSQATEIAPFASRLATVVARLASTPDHQETYLQRLGVGDSADELALEFDDMYRPVEPLLHEAGAPEAVRRGLLALNEALVRESLGWTAESLAESREWVEVRQLAAEALRSISAWQGNGRLD